MCGSFHELNAILKVTPHQYLEISSYGSIVRYRCRDEGISGAASWFTGLLVQ